MWKDQRGILQAICRHSAAAAAASGRRSGREGARNRNGAMSEKQKYGNERDDTELNRKDLEMLETTVETTLGQCWRKLISDVGRENGKIFRVFEFS